MIEDLTRWAEALEQTMATEKVVHFDRAYVLSVTGSTQDAARRLCGGRPGVVVLAGRQTEGRGRQGRTWEHAADLGLAVSFCVPATDREPGRLSLGAGVAVARAVEGLMTVSGAGAAVGLKWPNDLIEREGRRKIAGVLVELTGAVALIGVGVNVSHGPGDWPAGLANRAVSLRELGCACSPLEVARRLMVELDRALCSAPEAVLREWVTRDVLIGHEAEFEHDGKRFRGRVESISPLNEIVIRDGGGFRSLPAQTTHLVRG
jgi:BirA family biotin operon repressor/biotin-[acetyl-CoA-carboxylase] ligase